MLSDVPLCSAVCGGGPTCAVVVLCVRRSSVFDSVQQCLLPFKFGKFGEFGVSERPAGVTDTWYNMRRRIVTFISCVHLPGLFLSVTFVCMLARLM